MEYAAVETVDIYIYISKNYNPVGVHNCSRMGSFIMIHNNILVIMFIMTITIINKINY